MTLRLHIDRLIVDAGLGAGGCDATLLKDIIAAELARLLADDGENWAPSEVWRVDAPAITAPAEGGAEALGTAVAGAIHGSVRS